MSGSYFSVPFGKGTWQSFTSLMFNRKCIFIHGPFSTAMFGMFGYQSLIPRNQHLDYAMQSMCERVLRRVITYLKPHDQALVCSIGYPFPCNSIVAGVWPKIMNNKLRKIPENMPRCLLWLDVISLLVPSHWKTPISLMG